MTRILLRTFLGLGLALGFGLLPLILYVVDRTGMGITPDWSSNKGEIVSDAAFGIANFFLAVVGILLFWAVRDLHVRRAWAALLFVGAAFVSLFLPLPLMNFWPYLFTGDAAFGLHLAPFVMLTFAVPALVVFCVSLIFARWHRGVAASQPSRLGPVVW